MKKHFLILALLLSIGSGRIFAAAVTLAEAQSVALSFFKLIHPGPGSQALSATLKYTKTLGTDSVAFFVFDISPVPGFVIVAGDDNVIPILAYSTESHFRTDFAHTGLNHWVGRTAASIRLALQHNTMADARIQDQWSAYRQGQTPNAQRSGAAAPLCVTRWDQEMDTTSSPPPFLYNLFCPYNSIDQQRCVTGCVATAMAQVMKYWNYPAQGAGQFSYVDDTIDGFSHNYGSQSSDFGAHTYQWALMPEELETTTPYSSDSAVDLLMYDCGVSVGMDYGDDNQGGSGANALFANEWQCCQDDNCSEIALPRYFGYDADSIKGVFEANFSAQAWTALIENEINMGRPVIYEGEDYAQDTSGHAWVCDGYDTLGNLHMNWGWSGSSDGYFAINNLTTPGNFDPINDEDALIGILPRVGSDAVRLLVNKLSFSLYPNPASENVVLQTSITGGTWEFTDIVGQSLISGSTDGAQTQINISSLTDGVYFVTLKKGEASSVRKLVITR